MTEDAPQNEGMTLKVGHRTLTITEVKDAVAITDRQWNPYSGKNRTTNAIVSKMSFAAMFDAISDALADYQHPEDRT